MNRRPIARGRLHHIDCAVRRNGTAPAGEFLDALRKGAWDRADESGPIDEQISEYHWFINAIMYWASHGEPVYRHAVKALDDGIWEFRHGDKRLTFFDTDGSGQYTAKMEIRSYTDADAPESVHWNIPNFDHLIRLGHAFTKTSQKTLQHDLDESQAVRKEDLDHDRSDHD